MNKVYKETKELLKDVADYIRVCKRNDQKALERLNERNVDYDNLKERLGIKYYVDFSHEFRIRHIAMSLYRGTPMEKIESIGNRNLFDRFGSHDQEFIQNLLSQLRGES